MYNSKCIRTCTFYSVPHSIIMPSTTPHLSAPLLCWKLLLLKSSMYLGDHGDTAITSSQMPFPSSWGAHHGTLQSFKNPPQPRHAHYLSPSLSTVLFSSVTLNSLFLFGHLFSFSLCLFLTKSGWHWDLLALLFLSFSLAAPYPL